MTYEELINDINEKIKENGAGNITGIVLNEVLTSIVQAVTDNTPKKVVTFDGINNLTSEQVEQLNVGDVVVDLLSKNELAYTVSEKTVTKMVLSSVKDGSVTVVVYDNGEYFSTIEYELTSPK